MKKLLILFSVLLSIGLVGCTSKSEVKDVPVEDIKKQKEFYAFENVKDNIKEGFVLQAMINVKLQDVIVVKTDDVEKVKSAIEDYKENSLRLFADGYGGDENAKAVSNSILGNKGNYVYFIATSNAKDIEAKILESIK